MRRGRPEGALLRWQAQWTLQVQGFGLVRERQQQQAGALLPGHLCLPAPRWWHRERSSVAWGKLAHSMAAKGGLGALHGPGGNTANWEAQAFGVRHFRCLAEQAQT